MQLCAAHHVCTKPVGPCQDRTPPRTLPRRGLLATHQTLQVGGGHSLPAQLAKRACTPAHHHSGQNSAGRLCEQQRRSGPSQSPSQEHSYNQALHSGPPPPRCISMPLCCKRPRQGTAHAAAGPGLATERVRGSLHLRRSGGVQHRVCGNVTTQKVVWPRCVGNDGHGILDTPLESTW